MKQIAYALLIFLPLATEAQPQRRPAQFTDVHADQPSRFGTFHALHSVYVSGNFTKAPVKMDKDTPV